MECTFVHVQSDPYNIRLRQNMNFYDSHFKLLHLKKICGALIDSIADAYVFVPCDNDKESKQKLRNCLIFLCWTVHFVILLKNNSMKIKYVINYI